MQGMGRIGRSMSYGRRCAASVILYNEEDLKENVPGMTSDMRMLMRSSDCLKAQLSAYFGYQYESQLDWCCSAETCKRNNLSIKTT